MATFYFNGAVDTDWATLGNWWTDDTFTTQASALPASSDSVVISSHVGMNTGSAPTVVNLLVADPAAMAEGFDISITVTGNATFNNVAVLNGNITVAGNATFNDSSQNYYGTVNGDATFNDSSQNYYGTVNGDATFNDSSINGGAVNGDATFNDSSFNNNGTVTGDATFNDSSINEGTVNGDATFNDSSINEGTVNGDGTFNDSSFNNNGTVTGDVTLRGNASSYGYIGNPNDSTSVINLYDSSFIVEGSTVDAALTTFHNSSYGAVQNTTYYGIVSFANRTPHPIPRGINGSSILGVV